ncbi:hypothetical protein SLS62_002556 [Diatrype stigma]|uniref:Uncharacterized protein n=1 Tax=Diatrype stigma TaxID=117547 RepID=A0AAN9YVF4_9PEZI
MYGPLSNTPSDAHSDASSDTDSETSDTDFETSSRDSAHYPTITFVFSLRKADAFGTYSLGIVSDDRTFWNKRRPVGMVLFDTVNRRFVFQKHRLPREWVEDPWSGQTHSAYQLWNDMMIYRDPSKFSDGYIRPMALPLEEEWKILPSIHATRKKHGFTEYLFGVSLVDDDANDKEETAYSDLPIPGENGFDYDRAWIDKSMGTFGRLRGTRFEGDNDFVVLIERERFIAWSLHSDFSQVLHGNRVRTEQRDDSPTTLPTTRSRAKGFLRRTFRVRKGAP